MSWTYEYGGPADAGRSVLLLPGAWCTSAFYAELLAAPELDAEGVRLVAATPPGFGGNPVPDGFDWSVESYAAMVREKIEELQPDVVAAHSYFANVCIQMAIDGYAGKPLVLLSPGFSYEDEEKELKLLASASRVPGVGWLAWAVFPAMIGPGMRGRFPKDRHRELVREMKRTPTQLNRRLVAVYTAYLKRTGPLAKALVESGAEATVVFDDAHHFLMLDQPRRTLATVLAAVPR